MIKTIFDLPENEIRGFILEKANEYPQAFRILPHGNVPTENGTWASYNFDKAVTLWVDTSHGVAIEFYNELFQTEKERHMGYDLTVQEEKQFRALLVSEIKGVKAVVSKHITPEKILRMAQLAATKQPKLARCTPLSIINGVIGASFLNFSIGGPFGYCHMVPFRNRHTKKLEAELLIDYKGWIDLIYRSSLVKSVLPMAVFANETFDVSYGTDQKIIHKPQKRGQRRGEIYAAYCVVELNSGGRLIEVIYQEDADIARENSKAKDSDDSPWNKEQELPWMWIKTAVHKIQRKVPKSTDLQKAEAVESGAMTDEGSGIQDYIDAEWADITNGQDKSPISGKGEGPGSNPPEPRPDKKRQGPVDQGPASQDRKPNGVQKYVGENKKLYQNFEAMKKRSPEDTHQAFVNLGIDKKTELTEDDLRGIFKEVNQIVDLRHSEG